MTKKTATTVCATGFHKPGHGASYYVCAKPIGHTGAHETENGIRGVDGPLFGDTEAEREIKRRLKSNDGAKLKHDRP